MHGSSCRLVPRLLHDDGAVGDAVAACGMFASRPEDMVFTVALSAWQVWKRTPPRLASPYGQFVNSQDSLESGRATPAAASYLPY